MVVGADPEERDSNDFTPFHVALQNGHLPILNYFFENHPIEDSEDIYSSPSSRSTLSVALETGLPELVWTILDKGLATEEHISSAWDYIHTEDGERRILNSQRAKQKEDCLEEIQNIIKSFGNFPSPPSSDASDITTEESIRSSSSDPPQSVPANCANETSQTSVPNRNPSFRQHNERSQRPYYHQPNGIPSTTLNGARSTTSPINEHQPRQYNGRGRGRGRGRGHGRGRGRGRGRSAPRVGRGAPP